MFLREMKKAVVHDLSEAMQSGVRLYLDDESSTPQDIARQCVNEEMSYMPDYVWDELGELTEIRYNKICSK